MKLSKPKIVHAPLEIAGQVGMICSYLRGSGYDAIGYNYFQNYLSYDEVFQTEAYELIKNLDKLIHSFDIFHFHNSLSILEDFRDIEIIKDRGKKLIMHHRGTDVRFRSLSKKGADYTNPYVYAENSLSDEQINENLVFFAKYMDAAIVQDHELYKYVVDFYKAQGKPVFVLPRLIDTDKFSNNPPDINNKIPLIVHAPTSRGFKGSDVIEKTIYSLKKELNFQYITIEGLNHSKALDFYLKADIVIDQILCGAYGNVSVEAMAMGKPVVCFIRPDLVKFYPQDLPIHSANPDNLYYILKDLIIYPELRRAIGKQGRCFVEKHHEGDKVINKLISIYDYLLNSKRR